MSARQVMNRTGWLAAALLLASAPGTRAELLEDRLAPRGLPVLYGVGTTRLDGMGLNLAVPDENNEINVFDFGDNPAGLLSDRDSWSLDSRVSHFEYVERDPRLAGFDYKQNSYSVLAAFRKSGYHAIGAGVEFLETTTHQRGVPGATYRNSRYRLLYNRQSGRANIGLEFRYRGETEHLVNPREIYFIEHQTNDFTGIAGLSYAVHEYVTVAARGDLRRATVDGLSASDDHSDTFTWKRPTGSVAGQIFVNHPRVRGGASVSRMQGAGKESIEAGWSALFEFNPGPYFARFDRDTFTEKRKTDEVRARGEFDITPNGLTVGAAYQNDRSTWDTVTLPIVLGSRQASNLKLNSSDLGLAGRAYFLNQRLLVGTEFHHTTLESKDLDLLTGYTQSVTTNAFKVGGEFIALENLAVRAGLARRSDKREASSPDPNFDAGPLGSFGTTTASFGLGLVPSGGILLLDAAYSIDLSGSPDPATPSTTELAIDQSKFSLYARLLF